MGNYQSTIRAFQGVLTKFRFPESSNFEENFAVARFHKKMETPDNSRAKDRAQQCWERFLEHDEVLPINLRLPHKKWYEARNDLHRLMRKFESNQFDVSFPQGSEVETTRGHNSIESRLCQSKWTVTVEAFDRFALLCYRHKALKRAAKSRYNHWYMRKMFEETRRESDQIIYNHFKSQSNAAFKMFKWKLERIVTFVKGSRFSTVPKNNEKDRPINIEPFCNQLVQRAIGNGIRKLLKEHYGVDLDVLATRHRELISQKIATIDLKDASDSVSRALVRFLFPNWFCQVLEEARSSFLYGKDSVYHDLKKISSMGNGYTFELMTLILTSLCRAFDSEASVFGDDIIVNRDSAPELIMVLESVGFIVNKEKSFIDGPFRESCGANYHDEFGYLWSYDFKYPLTLHDCMVVFNKTQILSLRLQPFKALLRALTRYVPKALHGGPANTCYVFNGPVADLTRSGEDNPMLSSYFRIGGTSSMSPKPYSKTIKEIAVQLQYPERDISLFKGLSFIPELRSKTLRHLNAKRHWAKYEMYLHAGRIAKDVVTGRGGWAEVVYVSIGGNVCRYSLLKRIIASV